MSPEKEKYLFDNFPFFRAENAPDGHTLMGFGFDCGDGWFEIIKELAEKLAPVALRDFYVFQVKEKFGALRIYTGPIEPATKTALVERLIAEAEAKSAVTCETCGQSGTLRHKKWLLKTQCDSCA